MADSPEYGGTKINKKSNLKQPSQQQQPSQQHVSFGENQQMTRQAPMQQVPMQQPPMQQPPVQQPPVQQPPMQSKGGEQIQIPVKSKSSKSRFGNLSGTTQNALLVIILFILLNSKIIWRQIMKLPFMGSTEPSMIALFVNSLLAGIVFFIITKYVMNN